MSDYTVEWVSRNTDAWFADGYRITETRLRGKPTVYVIYPCENGTAPWLPSWANDLGREMFVEGSP